MFCDKCVYKTKGCTEEDKEKIISCALYEPKVVYCKDCKKAEVSLRGNCCICQRYGIKEFYDFCSEGENKNPELTADDILGMSEKEFIKNREKILNFIRKIKGG